MKRDKNQQKRAPRRRRGRKAWLSVPVVGASIVVLLVSGAWACTVLNGTTSICVDRVLPTNASAGLTHTCTNYSSSASGPVGTVIGAKSSVTPAAWMTWDLVMLDKAFTGTLHVDPNDGIVVARHSCHGTTSGSTIIGEGTRNTSTGIITGTGVIPPATTVAGNVQDGPSFVCFIDRFNKVDATNPASFEVVGPALD